MTSTGVHGGEFEQVGWYWRADSGLEGLTLTRPEFYAEQTAGVEAVPVYRRIEADVDTGSSSEQVQP